MTETVNVLGWFFDLQLDLLDVVSEIFKHSLGSLVKVLGVGIFPLFDPLHETGLDVVSLKTKSSNLVEVKDD